MKKIKTGIASYGVSGMVFHAPLLHVHKGFEIASILERTKNQAADRYPYARIVRNYEEMLADPEIELIVVNTPDHLHHEMCLQALEAGKNAVVEKPFTLTVNHADQLIRKAKEKRLMLSVFQNRRWDSDFLTVQKIVQEKMLGRLVEYQAHFDRFRHFIQPGIWKELAENGSGTLYNLGSHLIDQALVLFGMPDSVTADIRKQRTGTEVDDAFTLWLNYQEIKVTLKSSYLVRKPVPRYILHGTDGSFHKSGIDPQEETLKNGSLPGGTDWGTEDEKYWGRIDTNIKGLHYRGKIESLPGNYLYYYDNIFDNLRTGRSLIVTPEQARDVIRITEAALASQREQRAVSP